MTIFQGIFGTLYWNKVNLLLEYANIEAFVGILQIMIVVMIISTCISKSSYSSSSSMSSNSSSSSSNSST